MRAARAVLHIGFEKAGSTSIQRFLGMNHAALKGAGVLYPRSAGQPIQTHLMAAVMADERIERVRERLGLTTAEQVAGFRDALRRDLAEELAAARPHTLLISHETLAARLKPEEIARLVGFMAQFAERVEALAYVRRQDELPISLYSTGVLGGRTEPFAYPRAGDRLPAWFDYNAALEPWREVLGADAITVRRFGDDYFTGGTLLDDLTATLGLPQGLERTPRLNTGFDLARLEFVRLMNAAAEGDGDPRWRELARRLHDRGEGPRLGASRRRRRRLAARFEEANRRLARDYLGIEGPLFTHPLPDDPPPEGPWLTAEQAVALAVEMLRESGA